MAWPLKSVPTEDRWATSACGQTTQQRASETESTGGEEGGAESVSEISPGDGRKLLENKDEEGMEPRKERGWQFNCTERGCQPEGGKLQLLKVYGWFYLFQRLWEMSKNPWTQPIGFVRLLQLCKDTHKHTHTSHI